MQVTRCFGGIKRLSSRTLLLVASTAVALVPTGAARAQDLCANIDDLIDHSRSQFAEIVDKASGSADGHDVTLSLAGASNCFVTKQANLDSYHCRWEFPYRAKDAYDTFDAFVREMNECIGRHATLHSDRSVNHPDYYASRRYEMEQADVSVSVKDKGALGSTFVFIGVQGRKR